MSSDGATTGEKLQSELQSLNSKGRSLFVISLCYYMIQILGCLLFKRWGWLMIDDFLCLFMHVAMRVELDLKGTGNSGAKKKPAGRGKGASASAEKGGQASRGGAKRKRWKLLGLSHWLTAWSMSLPFCPVSMPYIFPLVRAFVRTWPSL